VSFIRCYQFGPFRLEAQGRILQRHGTVVTLPPKVSQILLLLLENAGRVVEKSVLLAKVWPDAFIEEGSLTRGISMLRKLLREARDGQNYIATISKCGYRFVAPVTDSPMSLPGPAGRRNLAVAVLPFANLSGQPDQEYFCDGLTEEMIVQLCRAPERFSVIPRTSAMNYKSTAKSIAQIGAELGVAYLLEGSVRRAGNRARITAQLVRAADQIHLWSQSYEREMDDILTLQSQLAQTIAEQIETALASIGVHSPHKQPDRGEIHIDSVQ